MSLLTRITTVREDSRHLLKRAWSVRFMAAAIVLSGAEVAFGVFTSNPPFDPRWFALASALTTGAAFYARFVAQKGITPEKSGDEQ